MVIYEHYTHFKLRRLGLGELDKGNLMHFMKAGLSQSFVAVIVDVKQEKRHHQKCEGNHVNAHLKRLQKARQRFPHPL